MLSITILQEDLVFNGGFEQLDKDGYPAGWSKPSKLFEWKVTKGISGRALQLSTTKDTIGAWSWVHGKPAKVEGGQEIEVVTHMKVENAIASHIPIEVSKDGVHWWQIIQVPAGVFGTGTFDWKEFRWKGEVPKDAKYLRPVLNAGWAPGPVLDGKKYPFSWSQHVSVAARYYPGWVTIVRTDGKKQDNALVFPSPKQCPYEFPHFSPHGWSACNSTIIYLNKLGRKVVIEDILANGKSVAHKVVGIWWETGWVGMGTKPVKFPVEIPANQKAIIQINEKLLGSTITLKGIGLTFGEPAVTTFDEIAVYVGGVRLGAVEIGLALAGLAGVVYLCSRH